MPNINKKTSVQNVESRKLHHFKLQSGATLIELMVGIVIGLLTVTVGLGALLVSRNLSSTVTDASAMQQQASYAFRVIGQQLRQAGARTLDASTDPRDPAKFVQSSVALSSLRPVTGKDAPATDEYTLSVSFQNAEETITPVAAPVAGTLIRDCLGQNAGISTTPVLTSQFKISGNELVCKGASSHQPIISGVKDFQIHYLQQNLSASTQQPQFRYAKAATLTAADWAAVEAVEICLELEGSEVTDTASTSYTKCDGTTADRGNRLRMVFRNTFNIRNNSWPSSL